ncbi:hypothetical protein [Lewinella sp. JB7]|uniref:hypothetical protein n=1 Tax=Lewinella sp. JB7 TaxID=2962887 RepID=UPI0020C9D667|nr:hypothetical protein [Lewinella sp. JB7]MCP9237700.1 hypothetical protein [Lewinella sp. JB7]
MLLLRKKRGKSEVKDRLEPDDFGPSGLASCQGYCLEMKIPRGMRRLRKVGNKPKYWGAGSHKLRRDVPELYSPRDGSVTPALVNVFARVKKVRPVPASFTGPDISLTTFGAAPDYINAEACSHASTCAQSVSATDRAFQYLAVEWDWHTHYAQHDDYYHEGRKLPREPVQMIGTMVTDNKPTVRQIVWVPILGTLNLVKSHLMMLLNDNHLRLNAWDEISQRGPGADIRLGSKRGLRHCFGWFH